MKRAIVPAAVLLWSVSAFGQAPAPAPPGPAAPPPPAETPAAPGTHVVTGQAPVVGGNAAGARERALDDAIRQAVSASLATLVDPQARAAQAKTMKAIEAKARSFAPRYRTLDEGEANGIYTVHLEVEVDEIALRRRLEKATPSTAPPPVTPPRAGASGVLVAAGDKAEDTTAFVTSMVAALAAAGTRASGSVEPISESAIVAAAASSRQRAALVNAHVAQEGLVRGTGRVAVSCTASARVLAEQIPGDASGGRPPGERTATARVFVDADKAADGAGQCRGQLAGELAGWVIGLTSGGGGAGGVSGGDLRTVTVDADVVEPAAIPELVKSLRGAGVVSAAELTRVSTGRGEIRVRTRVSTTALAAALSRVAGSMITLSDVQTSGDTIRVRARLRAAAPPPGAGGGGASP
jgi:hypothetical protein